jgi:hypothetical protein
MSEAKRKTPDWTRTGTVAGYAEWLRKKSDALAVVVVRRDDAALAADPLLAPGDARELLLDRVPLCVADLAAARKEKRPAARLQLGEMHE